VTTVTGIRRGAASGRERTPRLVLRFAVFTALGLAAAAAAILFVVRQTDTAQAERQAIGRARLVTAAVLTRELRAADLAARAKPGRRRELDRLFRERVLLEGIGGATVFDAGARVVYASKGGLPGQPLRRHVREALAGAVVSDVETAAVGRTLRTYVPFVLGADRIRGVVAVEEDYAGIEAAGRRAAWVIAGVLEALLLLLCLIFVPVLARLSSRIRRHVKELERVAAQDELTGLPNRLGFRVAVERVLAEEGSDSALVLIDIDGFSEINDVLGAESGDSLLIEVAKRLDRDVAKLGVVARLGEDEFGLLLHSADPAQIASAADCIRRSFEHPFTVDGMRIALNASIGAAELGEQGIGFAEGLRRAGAALSAAKGAGLDRFEVYDPVHEAGDVARLALIGELQEALSSGQLRVHYQPLADLSTRRIRGVEALLRWQHPERGLLTAGAFIVHAERSPIARELRRFVLETTARQWRDWKALGIELELAVNLTQVDLLDASLPEEIAGLLDRYGIPPWDLILELTERMLIGDERQARQVIEELHGLGVRLAVDDFGTGYSSLASLLRAPFQQVKLDHSLLAGVPGDAAAEAIVRGSVDLAHALRAAVVAEGIETFEQWEFVCDIGCDIAQGYLIGAPVPATEITSLLELAPSVTDLIAA
jgi:diguanylate cyclase (GGDEF)-like protein